jgi:hypothetical protein
LKKDCSTEVVAYFVDPIDFGQGTKIEVKHRLTTPLLFKDAYTVITRENHVQNTELIRLLLHKKYGK